MAPAKKSVGVKTAAKRPSRAIKPSSVLVNATDVPTDQIIRAMDASPELAAIANWSRTLRRSGGIFERDRYVTPTRLFDQFRTALDAVESDDVCSGALETTESLIFTSIKVVCDDEDEENVWCQILDNMEMEVRFREMWRELFTVSQFYVGSLWGQKDFKVQGETAAGNAKKRTFSQLTVPTALTVIDPTKVIPVGNFLFGNERLAYCASVTEVLGFDSVLSGNTPDDLIVSSLIERKMAEDEYDLRAIRDTIGAQFHDLYLMNKNTVFRHTATRPSYMKFASVRMKSVFELLDLKQQLRQMDRVYLTANTNFIVLVKKGSDTMPAHQSELSALSEQMRTLARVPVIVGDHRLDIEIITPKIDNTLKPETYNNLDSRITSRLFQMFSTGSYSSGTKGDDSIKLARLVARGMESRRKGIIQDLQKFLITPIFEKNADKLKSKPTLRVTPKRITLDFDPQIVNFILEARVNGDLSRETFLGEMEIDQEDEVRNRKREKKFDDIFAPPGPEPVVGGPQPGGTAKPLPAKTATKQAGRTGGRKGGTNPNSFTPSPPRGPAKPAGTPGAQSK